MTHKMQTKRKITSQKLMFQTAIASDFGGLQEDWMRKGRVSPSNPQSFAIPLTFLSSWCKVQAPNTEYKLAPPKKKEKESIGDASPGYSAVVYNLTAWIRVSTIYRKTCPDILVRNRGLFLFLTLTSPSLVAMIHD